MRAIKKTAARMYLNCMAEAAAADKFAEIKPESKPSTRPTSHTPGPWEVCEVHKYYHQIRGVVFPYGGARIASSMAGGVKNTQDQIDRYSANARLIAAAPDLLDALIAAHAYVPPSSPVHQQIGDAIAQARGTP